jgi:hypothetical protein
MHQKKGRYVKLNIADWLLIVIAAGLLLALILRGIGMIFTEKTQPYRAEVEFLICDLDENTAGFLAAQDAPFYLSDGRVFAEHYTAEVMHMPLLVPDENGELQETESLFSYALHVSFTAEGTLSHDGTFLLGGTRRLAMGEALQLLQGDVTCTAEIQGLYPASLG